MKEKESKELIRIAEGLTKTFVNRRDCFAVQLDDGRYVSVKEELTVNHIVRHLKGEITLGVYILGVDGTAKFAVIDADDEEGAAKLAKVHEALPLPSYRESSRRGEHLWFFIEKPVDAKLAKNFGLEIAKRFSIEAEVFPQQSESQGPGSCIRLPFGIHLKTGERYPFIGLGSWRDRLEALTNPERVPTEEMMKYQYQEPERKKKPFIPTVGEFGELPLWEKVKEAVTVEELVSQYVDLNLAKENYWHYFSGCGGGSVINSWMKMNDMDFKEATKDLAERLGVK